MLLLMTTPEDAVRRYLVYLTDPSSLVDEDAVAEAEGTLQAASDPIEKVRAHAALQKARTGDETGARYAFITHAKAWATEEQIPFSAFRELGVPNDVLEAAGLVDARSRRRGAPGVKVRKRAPKVSISELSAWMLQQSKPFTTADVTNQIGGSPATIKKALDELTGKKKLRNLGPASDWTARGRAPYLYSVASAAPASPQPEADGEATLAPAPEAKAAKSARPTAKATVKKTAPKKVDTKKKAEPVSA